MLCEKCKKNLKSLDRSWPDAYDVINRLMIPYLHCHCDEYKLIQTDENKRMIRLKGNGDIV